MIIETRPQVCPVFLNDVGRELLAFFVYVTGFMLLESFRGSFTCHAHIQTFKHPIKLGIRVPKSSAFGEHPFR